METRNKEAGTWRGGVEEVEKRMGTGRGGTGTWRGGLGIGERKG